MEELLTQLLTIVPMWVALLTTGIISACATICTKMDAPTDESSKLYFVFYKIVNFIGMNFGKAKNADEV